MYRSRWDLSFELSSQNLYHLQTLFTLLHSEIGLNGPLCEKTWLYCLRTTKAQTSLRQVFSHQCPSFLWCWKSYCLKVYKEKYFIDRSLSRESADCLCRDENLNWDWGAAGLSFTSVMALCPWARHIYPCLVLVQLRKTCPHITEKLLNGR